MEGPFLFLDQFLQEKLLFPLVGSLPDVSRATVALEKGGGLAFVPKKAFLLDLLKGRRTGLPRVLPEEHR